MKISHSSIRRGPRRWVSLLIILSFGLYGTGQSARPEQSQSPSAPLDLKGYELRLVYANDFGWPQRIAREEDLIEQGPGGVWRRKARPAADAEWIAEGWGGAEIRGGKLRLAPAPFDADGQPKQVATDQRSHMVIWNQRVFPADFLLEFEMSPGGSTNGLTLMLFCATGKNGEDLFDLSLPPRRADYQSYHSGAIANYTDSYWSRNNQTESISNRLRKNPGFKEVASGPSLTTDSADSTHHLRVLKVGAHIEVEVNGHLVLRWDDPEQPLGAGRVGLRSMEGVTTIAYDNFKVWQVVKKL